MTTTKGSLVANLLRTVPVLLQSTHEPTLEVRTRRVEAAREDDARLLVLPVVPTCARSP